MTEKDDDNDDDIREAMYDAACDAEGGLSAYYLRRHLEKRGLMVVNNFAGSRPVDAATEVVRKAAREAIFNGAGEIINPEIFAQAASAVLAIFTCGVDATHRHKKRGTLYRDSGDCELQSSGGPIEEGTILTTYVSECGRAFARPKAEFDDGRFEKLPPSADHMPEPK